MTKTDLLLNALKTDRSVTRGTAMLDFKIPNLSAIISTLRRKGHKIKSVRKVDGTGKPYTTWVLENKN